LHRIMWCRASSGHFDASNWTDLHSVLATASIG
jgi:hypothetical protein